MKHCFFIFLCALLLTGGTANAASAAEDLSAGASWRIRIREAAVVPGDMVTLGDIGEVHGRPPPGVWERLAARPLWPAPPEFGKPLQINRVRLNQALRQSLGDVADLCLLPASMAIQRGGSVLREDDIRGLIVRDLTPQMRAMDGEAELTDFRLPPYAFLSHAGQSVRLEPVKLAPGRLSFRFSVLEVDKSTVRRFTGTAMLELWAQVACAGKILNRGDAVTPDEVTWVRKNLAQLRGELWDGRGGPWQAQRAIGVGQPIYVTDLATLSLVKKGDIVTLTYAKGGVHLSVQAEALAEGSPGSTIPVRNLQSKKQVFATVRDAATVEVK